MLLDEQMFDARKRIYDVQLFVRTIAKSQERIEQKLDHLIEQDVDSDRLAKLTKKLNTTTAGLDSAVVDAMKLIPVPVT